MHNEPRARPGNVAEEEGEEDGEGEGRVEPTNLPLWRIHHFHKWPPPLQSLHCFVFMVIRPTALIFQTKLIRNLLA